LAFNLNGNNSYVDIGAWPSLTRWTVEAWVNPSVIVGGRRAIAGNLNSCHDWGIGIQDGQYVAFCRPPGGCTLSVPSGYYPQVGQWAHVVETVDGTNAIVYINGVAANTNAVDSNSTGDTSDVRIGSDSCCGEFFPGLIDEVRIYDRALAPAAVAGLFAAGPSGASPVGLPPSIGTPPTNTTATVFGPAGLCVQAGGPAPLSYQWYFGGVPIPGAVSACLDFGSVLTNEAGAYTVSVANTNGVLYSAAANLTVIDMKFYAAVPIYGTLGASYRIDYSTPSAPNVWTTLATIQLGSNPYIFIDYNSPGQNSRLYRVVMVP
jgi:hypothetical protein